MKHKLLSIAVVVVALLATAGVVLANPPEPPDEELIFEPGVLSFEGITQRNDKFADLPNPEDYLRLVERRRLLEAGMLAEANALAQTGTDRVLVVLVEFAGTDVVTWTAPTSPTDYTTGSQWDPYGIWDPDEDTGDAGDCSNIISQTTVFTYSGPMHNNIPVPEEINGGDIYTSNFSTEWFEGFLFGSGVVISYTTDTTDTETVYESFIGQSVTDFYDDMSNGMYTVTGDIVGWVGVNHSEAWYGADECPGALSGDGYSDGAMDDAGSERTLVQDALDAVNAISGTIVFAGGRPFDWDYYDQDGDGDIDRLWIVHAGWGEEEGSKADTLTTQGEFIGEHAVWSHSWTLSEPYSVTKDTVAWAYIMMPENGGMGVFAHEAGHNLGADDLYAYGYGETSAGFWTTMADDWTGFPIGFEPPAFDPWHLEGWGWLDPYTIISDTSQVYTVTLGQASEFPGGAGVDRAAKIELEDGVIEQPVALIEGSNYWWGGAVNLANGYMTTTAAIDLTGGSAYTLSFDTAYDIEGGGWDFMFVQVSTDTTSWDYLTNTNTYCGHADGWIGGPAYYNLGDDACGFVGHNAAWPSAETEVFDLTPYAGDSIYVRFWYMTDWNTLGYGPFLDNISVDSDVASLFSDDAESDANFDYVYPFERSDGNVYYTHNFYLQWRNVGATGGYDSALGDERWRFGPANNGMLVWYNNNNYRNNEHYGYLEDPYGFGPKGRMLVLDSHFMPYRNPYATPSWLGMEHTNLTSRGLMRDATFSLQDTVDFTYSIGMTPTLFTGRPAVPDFHDGYGYYPGVASEGDGTYWSTVDWDASAAMPAYDYYSVRGGSDYPGYNILWRPGWYGFWGWPMGGSGNPADDNVQYGWHAQILSQSESTATVRIWNSAIDVNFGSGPPTEIDINTPYTFTYEVAVRNRSGIDPAMGTVTVTAPANTVAFTTVSPPGYAISGGDTVVWASTTLTLGEWITFTVDVAVGAGPSDSFTDWTTSIEVDDGTLMPFSQSYSTHVGGEIYLPIILKN